MNANHFGINMDSEKFGKFYELRGYVWILFRDSSLYLP